MERVVRLVCWNPDLARQREQALKTARIRVDASPFNPSGLISQFRDKPTALVLIDLDRLPSHGREVGVMLRQSKSTRLIPLVFAGGVPEKVARIRRELPDAFFTEWAGVVPALRKALRAAPVEPVRPPAHMACFAGSDLIRKLGLKPEMQCALLGAPEDFEERLGELPDGLALQTKMTRQTALAIWFVRSRRELEAAAGDASLRMPEGCSVWIVHPKQAGRYKPDFNQNDVRAAGLAAGLVDYKVCAVDVDWSGLKFARRKRVAIRKQEFARIRAAYRKQLVER